MAPLIVAIIGALLLGEVLSGSTALAVWTIALGVILMAASGGNAGRMARRPLIYALGTAGFTAAYTLADAHGARLAGNPSAFALWMFVGDGLGMLTYALVARGPTAFPALLPAWRSGLGAGTMSLGSYWIAIWAFTKAPVAAVAALRETSVLFAMLIAVVFLHERTSAWRWAAASLIVIGIGAMRLGG
ncbi:MAG TPA: DMT family transporter [Salinarimonas sp.]|nr:DMT family transporter [Salinarimonas sp.]